jgi:hypothetical protein
VTEGDWSWAGPLTFMFQAPGVPPWPVLGPSGQPVGWVHTPTGLAFGPKTYILVDARNRPSLRMTQKGGLSAGGMRVLGPDDAELGLLRLTGVGRLPTMRIDLVAAGVVVARLATNLDELRDGTTSVTGPGGECVLRLALGDDDTGRAWFMFRWEDPPDQSAVPLLLALPLALHVEYTDRALFHRRQRAVGQRRSLSRRWPGL